MIQLQLSHHYNNTSDNIIFLLNNTQINYNIGTYLLNRLNIVLYRTFSSIAGSDH